MGHSVVPHTSHIGICGIGLASIADVILLIIPGGYLLHCWNQTEGCDRRYKCDILHPFKLVEPRGPAFHVFQFQVVPSALGTIFQLKLDGQH